jgi:hypothetical protein
LLLRSDLASLRSEHLLSRIDSLESMVFEEKNGEIVNVGSSHPVPSAITTTVIKEESSTSSSSSSFSNTSDDAVVATSSINDADGGGS